MEGVEVVGGGWVVCVEVGCGCVEVKEEEEEWDMSGVLVRVMLGVSSGVVGGAGVWMGVATCDEGPGEGAGVGAGVGVGVGAGVVVPGVGVDGGAVRPSMVAATGLMPGEVPSWISLRALWAFMAPSTFSRLQA